MSATLQNLQIRTLMLPQATLGNNYVTKMLTKWQQTYSYKHTLCNRCKGLLVDFLLKQLLEQH